MVDSGCVSIAVVRSLSSQIRNSYQYETVTVPTCYLSSPVQSLTAKYSSDITNSPVYST